ncbi:hypothetical protein C8A00DRAFT_33392 [Chaetomidium leptoderma]|uniref:Uncharacterized protein n=1 Tax=Chaetomidium leptoderma TaxID=669021 RepID=A0AAN6ZYR7_9PEZI|nr:hypothetical protein C8A00DRAFT_33392 [Chaetomidium leptoderma]
MGKSEFKAHYWRHKCPAGSPEDGDSVPSDRNHPDIKYKKFPAFRQPFFKEESILGKACTVDGCQYVANEETVILNKDREAIRNLGGQNMYVGRTHPAHMRCCKWSCRNSYTTGHSVHTPSFREPGNHSCTHALLYHYYLQNPNIQKRVEGCTCVMVNQYGEPVRTWEPVSWRGTTIEGSPLDLDERYYERKKKEAEALETKKKFGG